MNILCLTCNTIYNRVVVWKSVTAHQSRPMAEDGKCITLLCVGISVHDPVWQKNNSLPVYTAVILDSDILRKLQVFNTCLCYSYNN